MNALEDGPFHGQRDDQVPKTSNVLLPGGCLEQDSYSKRMPARRPSHLESLDISDLRTTHTQDARQL
jgi:hypothetical protein